MAKNMDNDMETGIMYGFVGIRRLTKFRGSFHSCFQVYVEVTLLPFWAGS